MKERGKKRTIHNLSPGGTLSSKQGLAPFLTAEVIQYKMLEDKFDYFLTLFFLWGLALIKQVECILEDKTNN